jgi:hypothetical protein
MTRALVLGVIALVLGVMLAARGHAGRAGAVGAVGASGVVAVLRSTRRARRWAQLERRAGRRTLRAADARLAALLDGAEDALAAIAVDGRDFRAALAPVELAVVDLARRALALGRVRAGHEATLARLAAEPHAGTLAAESRAEVERLDVELEALRRAVVAIGPSVRHLRLLADAGTAGANAGESPAEIETRLVALRHALAEELRS